MHKWEKPSCNFCHSKRSEIFLSNITTWEHPGKFKIVKCKNCGLAYLSPRPKRNYIGDYYPKETYWSDETDSLRAYSYLYEIIFRKKKTGKILDIGAGSGLFLNEFKKRKWEVSGVELSKDIIKFAKRKFGISLKQGDFLDYKFRKEYFDVITLNNVLEHLYKPQETLIEANKALKKDGLIVIVVPNIKSLGFYLYKKGWHALQPPRHLYHFSEYSLKMMLLKAGFKNIRVLRDYKIHNYYSLFESLRFSISPRFVKSDKGGLKLTKLKDLKHPSGYSVKKEIGKFAARLFAFFLTEIEPMIGMPEVITVYAEKN